YWTRSTCSFILVFRYDRHGNHLSVSVPFELAPVLTRSLKWSAMAWGVHQKQPLPPHFHDLDRADESGNPKSKFESRTLLFSPREAPFCCTQQRWPRGIYYRSQEGLGRSDDPTNLEKENCIGNCVSSRRYPRQDEQERSTQTRGAPGLCSR